MRIEAAQPEDALFEILRKAYRGRIMPLYDGWDDNIDRRFDDRSVGFGLFNDSDELCAAGRVIFNTNGAPLPLQLGDLLSFDPEAKPDELLAEGSGIWFKDLRYGLILMEHIGRDLVYRGVQRLFVYHDASKPFL